MTFPPSDTPQQIHLEDPDPPGGDYVNRMNVSTKSKGKSAQTPRGIVTKREPKPNPETRDNSRLVICAASERTLETRPKTCGPPSIKLMPSKGSSYLWKKCFTFTLSVRDLQEKGTK